MTDTTTPSPTTRRQAWQPTSPTPGALAVPPSAATALDDYVERLIRTTVARLIRRRVIRRDDGEDWEQDFRCVVLEYLADFDPARSSWHTYASRVVVHHLATRLRDRSIEQRQVIALADLGNDAERIAEVAAPQPEDRAGTQRRIQAVFAALPGDARILAGAYMARDGGHGGEQDQLGWTRWRYLAARKAIAEALRAAGLDPTATAGTRHFGAHCADKE